MKKAVKRFPERVMYRIDHSKMGEYFYNEVFSSFDDAQAYIDERNPKYRDKLSVVEFVDPAHESYHLGTIRL